MGKDLEKREKNPIVTENSQYVLAFGVIAAMLWAIGLPGFVIFFLGAFSFFLWKLFSSGPASETRKIFEFYLVANEILRADDRRWFGFEIQDAIARGEQILATMHTAPPLVYFALGSLYHKRGDFSSAIKDLEPVIEENGSNETSIVFPTKELREYVRVLRKIEREPAEAPQTSAAIRSLERLRKNKGRAILDDARHRVHDDQAQQIPPSKDSDSPRLAFFQEGHVDQRPVMRETRNNRDRSAARLTRSRPTDVSAESADETSQNARERKPISELLQDIYDDKVQ